MFFHTW